MGSGRKRKYLREESKLPEKGFHDAVNALSAICKEESTEFDKFGESMAAQLKALPIEDAYFSQIVNDSTSSKSEPFSAGSSDNYIPDSSDDSDESLMNEGNELQTLNSVQNKDYPSEEVYATASNNNQQLLFNSDLVQELAIPGNMTSLDHISDENNIKYESEILTNINQQSTQPTLIEPLDTTRKRKHDYPAKEKLTRKRQCNPETWKRKINYINREKGADKEILPHQELSDRCGQDAAIKSAGVAEEKHYKQSSVVSDDLYLSDSDDSIKDKDYQPDSDTDLDESGKVNSLKKYLPAKLGFAKISIETESENSHMELSIEKNSTIFNPTDCELEVSKEIISTSLHKEAEDKNDEVSSDSTVQVQTVSAQIHSTPKQFAEPCTSKITATDRNLITSKINYDEIKEKKQCYPPTDCIKVSSTCAESSLQSLIDNTVYRLSVGLEKILCSLNDNERKSLKIICKWGCDGSQQARYKQKFDDDAATDAHIFLSSFVPLRIVCGKKGKKVIWQNPIPSSPRYCRPIRFSFVKETVDVTNEEISYVEESAKNLTHTKVVLNGNTFMFDHVFKMTMIDGKVCNAATNTKSTSRCYICGATSKDFNNLNKKLSTSSKAIEFGLSVLHARIRMLESVLHLAYKLPIKKYGEKRTDEEKKIEVLTKKYIQERFRKETGLLIDMPKANFGNTNDGNTSRRFFENPQLAADITKVNFELIYRLKIILETISSGHKIDVQQFDDYSKATAKLYVDLYGWHPMTPTMHKILVHGAEIIENALLPIGQLSEEAAEAKNKHFRLYRENYARKFSREECNLDIFNRLLLTSDPLLTILISKKRVQKRVKPGSFCPETIQMLLPGDPNTESDMSDTDMQYKKQKINSKSEAISYLEKKAQNEENRKLRELDLEERKIALEEKKVDLEERKVTLKEKMWEKQEKKFEIEICEHKQILSLVENQQKLFTMLLERPNCSSFK
ncbi:unnamed protein product [Diabrotica balteata]|uniref:Uncharacterized protein n=1 Tax=Diabrotica balteata TaxID=107213 RepID=A0A9N9TDZ3_DIABA|nr:unnamed protein product [Diabrotica balteata]